MELRDKGYTLYKKGMKYQEIADTLGVSLSAVKSWASRYWKKEKVATGPARKVATKGKKKVATKQGRRGAPVGNVNAVGNSGGGAPPQNRNAFKHGGYATLWASSLTDAERAAIEDSAGADEEQILVEEIAMLSIREARLLERIQFYSKPENKMAVQFIQRSNDKRDFKRLDGDEAQEAEDKREYIERQDAKTEAGERLPGTVVHIVTGTEGSYQIVERLERLLTEVQRQKSRAVQLLSDIRARKGNIEIEDLDDVEAEIYGKNGDDGEEQAAPPA